MPISSRRLPVLAAVLLCLSSGCKERSHVTKVPRPRRAPPLQLARSRTLTLPTPEAPGGAAYVSAASGLVRVGDWLHVVADDSLSLASFPVHGEGPGQWARLFPGELPQAPVDRKARKPDLEALCLVEGLASAPHGALLAVPSGSAPARMRGALIPLRADGRTGGPVREVDFSVLYARLARELGSVNVEGAAWVGGHLWLLNRGNSDKGADAVVRVAGDGFSRSLEAGAPPGPDLVRSVKRWKLGRTHSVRLSFSDAAPLPDGRVVFTAAAEDTQGPYADGAVVGSAVGMLAPDGSPLWLELVDGKVKLEGVTARVEQGRLHLWLVSDADDPTVIAPLFELTLDDPPAALDSSR
jgi:hypothetical protein